jgi:HAD superfamily hydrolase (TIGR01490 family)
VTSAALFDLDRTLIDVNSGNLWVKHEWRQGRIGAGTAMWAVAYLALYHTGYSKLEAAFEQATLLYKGQPEAHLEAMTRTWFFSTVAHRLRPGAKTALQAHRDSGELLAVCTSSSTYAGHAASEAFGLDDVIATTFEIDEGLLTGKVNAMAYGDAKLDRTLEWADRRHVNLDTSTFYTDSYSDRALMERVGHPVAVNPDRRLASLARERGWPIVDWGKA